MKFNIWFFFLFGLLIACDRTEDGPTGRSKGPTASDGRPCIRFDVQGCLVKEERVTLDLDSFLSLVSDCSGECSPDYYPRNKFVVDKFYFEWGYVWSLDTIARTYYFPDTSEGTLAFTNYELIDLISKNPANAGSEFEVQLYEGRGTIISGLKYFQVTDGKMMYIDKTFQCAKTSVCDEFFRVKDQIESKRAKICSLKISLRFQDKPEDDLILTAVEYQDCR